MVCGLIGGVQLVTMENLCRYSVKYEFCFDLVDSILKIYGGTVGPKFEKYIANLRYSKNVGGSRDELKKKEYDGLVTMDIRANNKKPETGSSVLG